MKAKPRYRIITPKQYAEGYRVLDDNGEIQNAEYAKIRTLPNGNIVVKEPHEPHRY